MAASDPLSRLLDKRRIEEAQHVSTTPPKVVPPLFPEDPVDVFAAFGSRQTRPVAPLFPHAASQVSARLGSQQPLGVPSLFPDDSDDDFTLLGGSRQPQDIGFQPPPRSSMDKASLAKFSNPTLPDAGILRPAQSAATSGFSILSMFSSEGVQASESGGGSLPPDDSPAAAGLQPSASSEPVKFSDILAGEKVHIIVNNCFLLVSRPLCEVRGRLLVTNYRLKFQTLKGTLREELRWMQESRFFDVPMGTLEEVKEERATTVTGALELKLKVQTKDFRTLSLLVGREADCRNVQEAVTAFSRPGNPALLFAFRHAEEVRAASVGMVAADGWNLYDPVQEYARMGIETERSPKPASPWLVSRINAQYGLCASYPSLLVVPRSMADHELRAVAGFRKKGRLPAMSWCGGPELDFASVWRCSQTTEGLMGQKCLEDQKMVECIRRGANRHSDRNLLLIDLRPWKSAWANKANGGGFEGYPGCELVFGNVDNIHCVRDAWRAMGKAVNNVVEGEPGSWLRDVANSCWYDYIGAILHSTLRVIREILEFRSSVLLHCSDGWDRTAQATSLAMLCLDPCYRTQEGLLRLIQKEWCSFGHKFRTRLALGEAPSGEYSPVFIQWLECVYQLFRQFPTAFEWDPSVLVRLGTEAMTNRYGTFLCDSEKERSEKVMPFALSLWEDMLRPEEASLWFNWDYQPTSKHLIPNISQATYVIWEAYWFRHHPRGHKAKLEEAKPTAVKPAPGALPSCAALVSDLATPPLASEASFVEREASELEATADSVTRSFKDENVPLLIEVAQPPTIKEEPVASMSKTPPACLFADDDDEDVLTLKK